MVGWAANTTVVNRLSAIMQQNEKLHTQLVMLNNSMVDLYNLQLEQSGAESIDPIDNQNREEQKESAGINPALLISRKALAFRLPLSSRRDLPFPPTVCR
jgi:hypothetical protein